MKNIMVNSILFGLIITILSYYIFERLKKKYKHPLMNSILLSQMFIIFFLCIFKIDFDNYYKGAKYISMFLTPATICLAIPLYEEVQCLRKNFTAIIIGIFSGVFSSAFTILLFSLIFKLKHREYVTLLPKSITTAIGMEISKVHNGIVPITIAVIIITGVTGSILGEVILKIFKIKNPISKGVAYGSSAHALGTARAMEIGELEGAISSLSMVISAILTVIFITFFINLI